MVDIDSTAIEVDSTAMEVDSTAMEVDSTAIDVAPMLMEVPPTLMQVSPTLIKVSYVRYVNFGVICILTYWFICLCNYTKIYIYISFENDQFDLIKTKVKPCTCLKKPR